MSGKRNFIEKILVATDSSESANKALEIALDLAAKYSAEVVILSVVPPISPVIYYSSLGEIAVPPAPIEAYSNKLKESHGDILTEALKKAKKIRPDLKVITKLVEGRPAERIVEVAKEGNFDIIVMGSRGLGGIKEFFLGSVSDRVADEAACPVLIVKK